MKNNNKNKLSESNKEVQDDQELYLGDFLVRTEFFTKESFDRLILMEAKIGVMTEVMMSLRDVVHSYLEIDSASELNS